MSVYLPLVCLPESHLHFCICCEELRQHLFAIECGHPARPAPCLYCYRQWITMKTPDTESLKVDYLSSWRIKPLSLSIFLFLCPHWASVPWQPSVYGCNSVVSIYLSCLSSLVSLHCWLTESEDVAAVLLRLTAAQPGDHIQFQVILNSRTLQKMYFIYWL